MTETQKNVHTTTVEAQTRAEAIEKAREVILDQNDIQGELGDRPMRAGVEELRKAQKERVKRVASEVSPKYKTVYVLSGEGVESDEYEFESVGDANTTARSLALELKTTVEVHKRTKLIQAENDVTLTCQYQPAEVGEWKVSFVEELEVETDEEEDELDSEEDELDSEDDAMEMAEETEAVAV